MSDLQRQQRRWFRRGCAHSQLEAAVQAVTAGSHRDLTWAHRYRPLVAAGPRHAAGQPVGEAAALSCKTSTAPQLALFYPKQCVLGDMIRLKTSSACVITTKARPAPHVSRTCMAGHPGSKQRRHQPCPPSRVSADLQQQVAPQRSASDMRQCDSKDHARLVGRLQGRHRAP